MSPVLPEANTLAGHWTVAAQGSTTTCALDFTLRPLGTGYVAEHTGHCLESFRLNGIAAWRPATDGIALAAASGRTIAFFSHSPEGYVLRRPNCPTLVLSRVT